MKKILLLLFFLFSFFTKNQTIAGESLLYSGVGYSNACFSYSGNIICHINKTTSAGFYNIKTNQLILSTVIQSQGLSTFNLVFDYFYDNKKYFILKSTVTSNKQATVIVYNATDNIYYKYGDAGGVTNSDMYLGINRNYLSMYIYNQNYNPYTYYSMDITTGIVMNQYQVATHNLISGAVYDESTGITQRIGNRIINDDYYLCTYDTLMDTDPCNQILNGELIGTNLDKAFFSPSFSKKPLKIIFRGNETEEGRTDILMSICSSEQYPTATGSIYNNTFAWSIPDSGYSSILYHSGFYDTKSDPYRIYKYDNGYIYNNGGECLSNYVFSDFDSLGRSTAVYYMKFNNIYKYTFSDEELGLIGESEEAPEKEPESFGSGSVFEDSEVTESILDIDIDGDGEISIIEATLAPFTIVKNVINKIYISFKNLWLFLKSIMEIGNIESIFFEKVNASGVLQTIQDKTTGIITGTGYTEGGIEEQINNVINIIYYGFFFALFFCILILFLLFRKKT